MAVPREFIELVRENIAAAHVGLGISAHSKDDLESAVRHMQAAYMFVSDTRTRRNLALAYLNLADQYFFGGRYDAAITQYILSEEAGLLTPEGLNNRAIAHLHVQEVQEAIAAMEMALTVAPDNQITRSNLLLLKANGQALEREVFERLQTERYESEFQIIPVTSTVSIPSFAFI
jgi:tetratricopeptide (TPR) repeat protein